MQVNLDAFNQFDKQFNDAQAAQQPKEDTSVGGWIKNALPQIGSFAAPAIGALLAPETGGLSLIPAMALAGAGGAGGEALKEKLNKENLSASKILTQGAAGVGQEVGGRIIGGVLGAVGNVAADKVGAGLTKGAEDMASKAIRPTPAQMADFVAKHGNTIGNTMLENGLVGKSADDIASAIEPVQAQFNSIIKSTGAKVNPDDLLNAFQTRIEKLAASSHPADQQAANDLTQSLYNIGKKVESGQSSLADISKMRQEWDSHVDYNQKALNPADYTNNKLTADALRETIQKTAADNNLIGKGGESVKELGQKLNSLYDIKDLALRNQFKGGNALIKLGPTAGAILGEGAGATLGHGGGVLGAVAGGIGTSVANSPAAASAAAKVMSGLGEKLSSEATNKLISKAAPLVGGVASRYSAAKAEQPQTLAANPADALASQDNTQANNQSVADQSVQKIQALKDQQLQALQYDMATSGGKNSTAIQAYYKNAIDNATPTTTPLTKSQQTVNDALVQAFSSLDSAKTNLVSAGGAKGPIAGAVTNIPLIGQYTNTSGTAYNQTRIELATAMAKAITGGSRPAASVIDAYLHSLPSVSDTPEYAQSKLDKLYNDLLIKAKNTGLTDLVSQYSQ
jgi:hypothetical protein